MASDITRKTFTPRKHYSGVLMQQGRVQLDADWNEQLDIEQYRTHTESTDVIGQSGAPRAVNNGNSFKITIPTSGTDIQIDWGRIYVEGLLCELEQPTTYLTQPQYPLPDTSMFNPLPGSPASPPGSPASPVSPASPTSPPNGGRLSNGTYLAYLDAWQREVNYLDDPQIQEVALGGADTATRLQTAWQVKLLQVSANLNNTDNCDTGYPAWTTLTQTPSGKLNVQIKQTSASQDPCLLPPSAGFRRVENQLYRVEVHRGGTLAQTTFKWSRDNATVETIIEKVQGGVLTVASTGKDEVLNFAFGHWVEMVDDLSDLNQHPQRLYQVIDVKHETRQITLDVANLTRAGVGKMKLRRWDQSGAAATVNGVSASNDWLDLEDGIQVQFSAGTYQPGDYWLVPARTIKGSIEWPQVGGAFQPQSPLGVHHVFARLALLKANNGVVTVADCRKVFHPLTNLHASDIYYDNSGCLGSSATTVQEALDILCRRNGSACTFIAQPGPGWESVFSQILPGQDAQICFQAGLYPLSEPVTIARKGNLKLIGAGRATRIVANNQEKGLVFDNCGSVLARDLYVETNRTGSGNIATADLNGGLNFISCKEVQVDTVDLKCGSGRARAATCITVHDADIVRIQNCDLSVGHYQQGLLMVNVKEVFVSQNTIKTYRRPSILDFTTILSDNIIRANFRRALASNLRITAAREPLGERNVEVNVSNRHIALKTPSSLKDTFKSILTQMPTEITTDAKIRKYVDKTVERLLLDEQYRKRFPVFEAYYVNLAKNTDAVSTQAITVGGTIAQKIKITDNTIENAMQGIHVAVSHHAPRNVHDHSGSVLITNNHIGIKLPANTHRQGRHGIFVGNCKDLLIENNTISLTRLSESDYIFIDGIRVWGILGSRLMIAKNNIHDTGGNPQKSFNVGIRVNPINPIIRGFQWIVMWNAAPSKQNTVIVKGGAVNVPATNFP